MENVLRQVRERMQVDPVTNIESNTESLSTSKTDGIKQSFPQWLASIVGAQQMWSEIRNMKGEGGGMGVHDKLAFEFFFEERVWQMVSMIDQFDLHKISKEVVMRVEEKMRGEETNSYEIIDFIQALGTVMQ